MPVARPVSGAGLLIGSRVLTGMTRSPSLALAVVLTLAVAATTAAARRPATCTGAEGRTVAASAAHRLFVTGAGAYARLYVCRPAARPRLLTRSYDDGYVASGRFLRPALHGRHAAYIFVSEDVSCKAGCPEGYEWRMRSLHVVDLSTGRISATRFGGTRYVLTGTGAVAWIAGAAGGEQTVMAFVRGELRTLAQGTGIDAASLEASATRVSWLQDGRLAVVQLPA